MTRTRIAQTSSQYDRSVASCLWRQPEISFDDPAIIAMVPIMMRHMIQPADDADAKGDSR